MALTIILPPEDEARHRDAAERERLPPEQVPAHRLLVAELLGRPLTQQFRPNGEALLDGQPPAGASPLPGLLPAVDILHRMPFSHRAPLGDWVRARGAESVCQTNH
ncbi:MAG TPA: hypothetical protein VFJ58_19490, partial [Armatimonadota bacterium]|nr:hypothetical protein [Armatimonadota bacterium]